MPEHSSRRNNSKSSGGAASRTRSAGSKNEEDSPSSLEAAHADVDPSILAAIRLCIREENKALRADIKSLQARLDKLDKLHQTITTLTSTITTVENGLQYASQRLDYMEEKVIPAINNHIASIAQRHFHESLKKDAHGRKWNVVLHGVDGPAGEDESDTRNAVKDFAQAALKLSPDDITSTVFQACHRLSQKENAGIIIRFVDLTDRDKWLAGAKNIQSYISELRPPNPDKKISMAIDLPPNIRPLKDNLMKKRRELPFEKRRRSKLRYLAKWPFVELRVEGESPIRPTETLADITKATLGLDLHAQIPPFENG